MVGCPDGVLFRVGQLPLDHVWPIAHLVEHGRRHSPKAVARHARVIAQSVQREEDRILAHGLARRATREYPSPLAVQPCSLRKASTACCDSGTWCGATGLHSLGRNGPLRLVQVDLSPGGTAQLGRSHECQGQKLATPTGFASRRRTRRSCAGRSAAPRQARRPCALASGGPFNAPRRSAAGLRSQRPERWHSEIPARRRAQLCGPSRAFRAPRSSAASASRARAARLRIGRRPMPGKTNASKRFTVSP